MCIVFETVADMTQITYLLQNFDTSVYSMIIVVESLHSSRILIEEIVAEICRC